MAKFNRCLSGAVCLPIFCGVYVVLIACGLLVCLADSLVGLVVRASASTAEDPGFKSRLRRDFLGSSHTSDFNIGTTVATLPDAWRYRVSARTAWAGISILCLD